MVRSLAAVAVVLFVLAQSLAFPATATASAEPAARAQPASSPPRAVTGATDNGTTARQADTIVEHRVVDRTPETPGQVTVTYRYEIAISVVELETELPVLDSEGVRVVSTEGFSRADGQTFQWDTTTRPPSVTIALSVPTDRLSEAGVDRDSYAFAFLPGSRVRASNRGAEPSFEFAASVVGDGLAVGRMAYVGPARVITGTTVQGTEVSVAVADAADPAASPEEIATAARILVEDFRLGQSYERTGVFVLPDEATPGNVTGQNLGDSYWVQGSSARLDTVETTLTHEFAHTRIGQFESGGVRWLTEGAAEYYGYVLALNQGSGNFSEFESLVDAYHDEYAPDGNPVVLRNPRSWRGTVANYQKGALVLAALDARIRNLTDGDHRLRDVLAVRFREQNDYNELRTYDDFRRAVVDVTGEESLGPWLDRYVTTEAVPTVPDNPYRFVTRWGADPDRDTLSSEREREADTNPFDEDTDGDSVRDFIELRDGLNASNPDTDGDGLLDDVERASSTNATNPDTDGDDVDDGTDAYPTDGSLTSPTPEPTATPAATATATTAETVTDTTTNTDTDRSGTTDASGPGPGVAGAMLGVLTGSLGVTLRHRVGG